MSDLLNELAAEASEQTSSPADGALEVIRKLALEASAIDDDIKRMEEELDKKKKEKNEILQRKLVDVMNETGVPALEVDGKSFRVENYYHASIPKDKADDAHSWLEDNEHGSLIKYEIIISLPKDSTELAKKIEAAVRQLSNEAEIETKRQVPWARLTSWLKEYVETVMPADPTLPAAPLDLLGATVGKVVKIKPIKKK